MARDGLDPAAAYQEALSLLAAGDARRARSLLLELLKRFPREPRLSHACGAAYLQLGEPSKALPLLRSAVEMTPRHPAALGDLGLVLHTLGRFEEALACFDRALDVLPEAAEIHVNRANSLVALGRPEEALVAYSRAIEAHPSDAPAHYHRGILLTTLRRGTEALASFDAAIASNPFDARFHCNRGAALEVLLRDAEALDAYRHAIELDPDLPPARLNFGELLLRLGRAPDAEVAFAEAVRRFPKLGGAHRGRGDALRALGRLDEALAAYDAAIRARGDDALAHNARGNVLSALGRQDAALAAFDRAIRLSPGYAAARFNKGLVHLLRGEYTEGWRLYDAYWESDEFHEPGMHGRDPVSARPRWRGDEDLDGLTVLIHCREGFGDFIQFVRYAHLLRARGARVVVEAHGPIVELFSSLGEGIRIVPRGSPVPEHDVQCPAMSLPHAFRTTLDSIPGRQPYLHARRELVSEWRERLGPRTRARIGLAWSGRPSHANDSSRSVPIAQLAALLDLPVEFHCVQNAIRRDDLDWMQRDSRVRDHRDALSDFSQTAALMSELDLVVCVDTSVAHLAGAIGRPVWILLSWVPDFRWMLQRQDSPWYPTARLFRQPRRGDWETVVRELRCALLERFVPAESR